MSKRTPPRQVFHHYETWEDHAAGMYANSTDPQQETDAAWVLSDPEICGEAMRAVVESWPYSTAQNLTDQSQNRRAWLGQAACCLRVGATARATKLAWWTLTQSQQDEANRIAESIIRTWIARESAQADLTLWDIFPSLATWEGDHA